MIFEFLEKYPFKVWLVLITLGFVLFYPNGILVSDEISYLSLSQKFGLELGFVNAIPESLSKNYQNYVLGYPSLLLVFSLLFSLKAVFVVNFILLIVSVILVRNILFELQLDQNWAYALFFFLPMTLFSRLVMSEMASLLIISIGLYFYIKRSSSKINIFYLGLTCGLSYWIKESNIVLLMPLCFFAVLAHFNKVPFCALGLILGLIPFLVSNYVLFDTIGFRNTGVHFGFDLFWSNLFLLGYIFLLLFPLGFLVMYKSDIANKLALSSAIGLYVILYLFYQYNGLSESGFKTFILYPRYFIAIVPMMILFYAAYFKERTVKWFSTLSLTIFYLVSMSAKYLEQNYHDVSVMIQKNVADGVLNTSYSLNEVTKIVNPFSGEVLLGNRNITEWRDIPVGQYYIAINRTDTKSWRDKLISIPPMPAIDSLIFLNHIEYKLYKK